MIKTNKCNYLLYESYNKSYYWFEVLDGDDKGKRILIPV